MAAALVADAGGGLDGSAFVAGQQWLHDLDAFESMTVEQQDSDPWNLSLAVDEEGQRNNKGECMYTLNMVNCHILLQHNMQLNTKLVKCQFIH